MKKLLFPVIALTLLLLMAAPASASVDTIWTIGTIGDGPSELGDDFLGNTTIYNIGVDGSSDFPCRLYIVGYTTLPYVNQGVHQVTINFTLDHWYYGVILRYARYGAEGDNVTLDGGTPEYLAGPGEGVVCTHEISLGPLSQGDHSIVIECVDDGGADGCHSIDGLELIGGPLMITKELTFGESVVDIATEVEFTMEITVENLTGELLEDVEVHDRLGAELFLDLAEATDGDVDTWTKGKSKKWFIDWTNFSMNEGESETLTMEATTDINPGGGHKIHQEYTSEGTYDLNSGAALVSVTIGGEVFEVDSKTPPLTVEAVGEETD